MPPPSADASSNPSSSTLAASAAAAFPTSPSDLLGSPYDALLAQQLDNPLALVVKETQWSVLERFSRVTRTAAMLLEHPYARPLLPYIPHALQPVLTSHTVLTAATTHEYEPARVYLARWAHELQVARSRDHVSETLARHPPQDPAAAASASGSQGMSMLSSSISLLSSSMIEAARSLTTSGRLRMLYEEEHVVWDETVQAETGIGTFEVLSTDTTPPPPKVQRLKPLSSAEWRLYFDHYVPLPPARKPPSLTPVSSGDASGTTSMAASMIHVSHDDSLAVEDEVVVELDPELPRNCDGKIVVPLTDIQRRIFAGGIDESIRGDVWRFLFGLYAWDSTYAERKAVKAARTNEYWRLKQEWLDTAARLADVDTVDSIPQDDKAALMYYDAVTRVDKDILRTDRQHPFYKRSAEDEAKKAASAHSSTDADFGRKAPGVGPGPPNLNVLRDVLITYAASYAGSDGLGYVQGMSDLASPFVVVTDADEVDAFWCFAFSMEALKSNFLHDGSGMRLKLQTMERLISRMDPGFHAHLRSLDALNLFFCFRWFLVNFKREFPFDDVCRIWEVMASEWAGDEFAYFIALAILDEHRDAVMRHLLTFDELLKYTNDLSGTIPVNPILEAAELLYLRFRVNAASLGALPVVQHDAGESDLENLDLVEHDNVDELEDDDGIVLSMEDTHHQQQHSSGSRLRSRRHRPSRAGSRSTAVGGGGSGAGIAGRSRGGIRLLGVLDRMAVAEAEARAEREEMKKTK